MEIKTPVAGAVAGAAAFFNFELMSALVSKGIFSREEASAVMLKACDHLRTGTETGPYGAHGEVAAQLYETMAGWLLGQGSPPRSP